MSDSTDFRDLVNDFKSKTLQKFETGELRDPDIIRKQIESIRLGRELEAELSRETAANQWSGKLKPDEKAVAVYVARYYGLDPNLRHLEILGGNLYVTVAGLRHIKSTRDEYRRLRVITRPCTRLEREGLEHPTRGIPAFAFCAEVYCGNELMANSFGVTYNDELKTNKASGSHPMQMAETRAEGRALRKMITPLSNINVSELREDEPKIGAENAKNITPETIPPTEPQPNENPDSCPELNGMEPESRDEFGGISVEEQFEKFLVPGLVDSVNGILKRDGLSPYKSANELAPDVLATLESKTPGLTNEKLAFARTTGRGKLISDIVALRRSEQQAVK